MRLRGAGVIVNIASELAFKAAEGCTIYCATEAASYMIGSVIMADGGVLAS